jgi:predicted nucleic acid-binding Zn ribbon protein
MSRPPRTDWRRAPRRRAPVPLAGAVEALAARLEPLTPLSAVQRAWPEVVGEVIAAEAEPVAERGGVVTVRCRSAVWAQELSLMAPDLVDRINAALGVGRVTELRCTAAGRRGPR